MHEVSGRRAAVVGSAKRTGATRPRCTPRAGGGSTALPPDPNSDRGRHAVPVNRVLGLALSTAPLLRAGATPGRGRRCRPTSTHAGAPEACATGRESGYAAPPTQGGKRRAATAGTFKRAEPAVERRTTCVSRTRPPPPLLQVHDDLAICGDGVRKTHERCDDAMPPRRLPSRLHNDAVPDGILDPTSWTSPGGVRRPPAPCLAVDGAVHANGRQIEAP